jgi:uncharacterized protein (DUF2147 family)
MKGIAPHMLAAMLVAMACTGSHAQEQLTGDDLFGEWLLPENGSVIRAHQCGDRFCGSEVKVGSPKLPDNGKKRNPPGILIPSNLQKIGVTAWRGEFRNLRDGDTCEGTIKLIDKNRLNLIRCIIGSVLCETVTFHRITPPGSSELKREHRAIPVEPLTPATPRVSKPNATTVAPGPSRADFEAFLRERGITVVEHSASQDEQALFKEFLAWRRKQLFTHP